jgi:hypothetical protein
MATGWLGVKANSVTALLRMRRLSPRPWAKLAPK